MIFPSAEIDSKTTALGRGVGRQFEIQFAGIDEAPHRCLAIRLRIAPDNGLALPVVQLVAKAFVQCPADEKPVLCREFQYKIAVTLQEQPRQMQAN